MNKLSENVKEWNAWELRTLILLSLFLQILLVIFGNRRKYMAGRWLGAFVWLAYLSADWVATFSVGVLARSQGTLLAPSVGDEGKNSTNPKFIPLFWAPALLLHLGGPDTITAYAMEDNQLWIRRLLEAITQVFLVIYVLIKLWSKDNLPFVAILIFFVGLYKYGERIWALRLANPQKSRVMEMDPLHCLSSISEVKFLCEAHWLSQMFRGLLSNLLLMFYDVQSSRHIISLHATEIFKLVEVELGFAYDVLYTKITGVQFSERIVLRSISFLLTISASVVFATTINKLHFSTIDIFVSYILLVGAIIIEIYSIMVLLFSNRTMLWIGIEKKAWAKCFHNYIWSSRLRSFFNNDNKQWSGWMAQHDLLIAFRLRKNRWDKCLEALVEKGAKIQQWQKVSEDEDLKHLIFIRLLQKSGRDTIRTVDSLRTELEERGSEVLRRKNCSDDFRWSVVELEFDQSLLVWHIATSICYWDEFHKNGGRRSALHPRCRMSQSLSNYMMYLLVECPLLLPKGIYGPRYIDTETHMAYVFLSQREPMPRLIDRTSWVALDKSIREFVSRPQVQANFTVQRIKEQTSARDGGLKLATSILEKKFGSSREKWEMISEVWVEMLIYAAGQCDWKEHAQALARGGELITLVSLLKVHLGLTLQRSADIYNWDDIDKEFYRRERRADSSRD